MENWQSFKLKDLCEEITVGHVGPMANEYVENGVTFLRSQNIHAFHLDLSDTKYISIEFHKKLKKSALKPGDVVVVRTGYPGTACVVPLHLTEANCADLVIIRTLPQLDPYYLTYILNSAVGRSTIAGRLVGVAQQHFNISAAKEMHIKIPPLPIQRTIASILAAYDNLIENNTRRIAILEEMAQRLYQEWFVKFRFPGYEGVRMVESALGMIPEGWEVAKLGDIATEQRRSISPEAVDPETPYFGLEHLPRKSIALTRWETAKTVQSTKLLFKRGEILFGKIRPYLHKIGVAPLSGVCSSDTIVISPKHELYRALLLCCVSSEYFVAFASKTAQGTQMPRANWNVLSNFLIAIPPPRFLFLFNDLIESSIDQIINFVHINRNLRRTRDRLLPKLISGEIDVTGWVEGKVEEEEMVGSVAGMARGEQVERGYEVERRVRRVAETVEPLRVEELEWRSLWDER